VVEWQRSGPEPGQDFSDVLYDSAESIDQITVNRPEVRNAFRPTTVFEPWHAFNVARDAPEIGVIILTGTGETSEEPQEGRNAHQEKRKPDFVRFPRRP
jgi:naphthoate synthase